MTRHGSKCGHKKADAIAALSVMTLAEVADDGLWKVTSLHAGQTISTRQ